MVVAKVSRLQDNGASEVECVDDDDVAGITLCVNVMSSSSSSSSTTFFVKFRYRFHRHLYLFIYSFCHIFFPYTIVAP